MPSIAISLDTTLSGSAFAQRIEHECRVGSAIAPALYSAAIEIIYDTGYFEPNYLLGRTVSHQWQTHKPHSYGALAVFLNEDEAPWQAKPEIPRVDKKGKEQKYEAIKGSGLRAFTPAIPVGDWVTIAKRHNLEKELPTWVKNAADSGNLSKKSSTDDTRIGGEIPLPEREAKPKPIGFTSLGTTSKIDWSKLCSRDADCSLQDGQRWSSPPILGDCSLLPCSPTQLETLPTKPSIGDGNSIETDTLSESSPAKNGLKASKPSYQGRSFWKWVELHLELPLIITEGGKKSLALLTQGYVAIALYGARGGVIENEIIGGEKVRKLKPELIPDLIPFAAPGRSITIALDEDDKAKTRADVDAALSRLGGVLTFAGCEVKVATWSQTQGKGVDDLIVTCGAGAWDESYSNALPLEDWSIAHRIANRVKRRPDRHIGQEEFSGEMLPRTGTVGLHGGKGTRKSKSIGEALEGRTWLSITTLRSLARDQAQSWGGVYVNDGDQSGSTLLKHGVPVSGGSVCIPSLLKVRNAKREVLILDELPAILAFLFGSNLANQNGIRPLLAAEFTRRVKEAELVIFSSADLTEDSIQWVESAREGKPYLLRTDRTPLAGDYHIIDGTKNQAITMALAAKKPDKVIYINSDAKTLIDSIEALLNEQGIKSLKLTQDTSGGDVQLAFIASKGKMLPLLISQGVQVILSSPTLTQGFSLEHNTDLIDSVWGIYSGGSIAADAIAQSPDRVRNSSIPRYLWIAKKGSAYSRLSKATNAKDFLNEFKSANTTAARLVRHSLTPDVADRVEAVDWGSANLKLLASIEVERNQGMMSLRKTVIAHLRYEGKQVSMLTPTVDREAVKAVTKQLSDTRTALNVAHAKAVEAETDLTDDQAKTLEEKSKQSPLTTEELLQLEKYFVSKFYRIEQVGANDVLFDRKGKTRREVRNLETVLSAATAEARTVKSMELNPDTPQDWNRARLQHEIIERSGAGALIRLIWNNSGDPLNLSDELIAPIAQFLRVHAKEFEIAFGFRNLAKVGDRQAVGVILDWMGLKRQSNPERIDTKKTKRFYTIDPIVLAKLKSIVGRRTEVVTPPQDEGISREGVTDPNPDDWMAPHPLPGVCAPPPTPQDNEMTYIYTPSPEELADWERSPLKIA